ncbi:MAG: winged helix-turn-helix domain-containing protein [Acidobacteria bacterium]|nr:winged helix-turn-helix domain-containing protein [Acidobacteriota bacterium]
MAEQEQPTRLRFDSFEIDLRTRELRKDGRLLKLQDQPIKLLALLANRPGELVTREEIEKALWNEGEFVEFEHSINTAVRKIREVLGDDPERPRFIETLPRKGYRFIAPVEANPAANGPGQTVLLPEQSAADPAEASETLAPAPLKELPLSAAGDPAETEFALPRGMARTLFLTTQVGYLAMYGSALYFGEDLERALLRVLMVSSAVTMPFVTVSAMCGIAVRLYLLSSVGLDHPASGVKFRKLFPLLFALDIFWAASPLLLARKIGYGLALGCVAALAYLPFSQRTLVQSIYRGGRSGKSAESAIARV